MISPRRLVFPGASKIYSAFIYQGFGMVERAKKELSEMVKKDGFENIVQAVGSRVF